MTIDPSNTQRRSTIQHVTFRDMCRKHLREMGVKLLGGREWPQWGVTVHEVAMFGHNKVYIRYCGSWAGIQPGLKRSDTVKKFLQNAYSLKEEGDLTPFIEITNHMPKRNSVSANMLKRAAYHGKIQGIYNVDCVEDEAALRDLAGKP